MSALLVWVTTCEICDTTAQFDGSLSVEELGVEANKAGWTTPVYGGTFCPRCSHAVATLNDSLARDKT